ncbi:anti-sigma factor family protein [Tundrisphaera lichenicola]|uniref:anti-sigma factor family protein n=1 Tax=Tundrisphaera lichenicola TaxID=2029860 RepID=UPI003EBD13D6
MVPDQQRLSPEDRSNLVAYLDGELNEAQTRAISAKLAQSTTARREVAAFQKTWDMLDLLPRTEASDDFASRTLTFATVGGVPGERMASAASAMARTIGIGVAYATTLALMSVVGYFLVARLWPDPTARLARDLPIAESLDEYLDVGSIEYLEKIDVTPEFN